VRETPATVEVVDQQTIQDRGYRDVIETTRGAVGVTAGNPPGGVMDFSMRGLVANQINKLYNGIKLGPMSSRNYDTFNYDRVEFLKGPSSLMSGDGAIGGAVNYVTKAPHTGPVMNEAFVSYDSFGAIRTGIGSGGSTAVQGLDYRFDLSRSWNKSFIEDTEVDKMFLSTRFDYRLSESFKVFAAVEYNSDNAPRAYWGTPLVSTAFSGANAVGKIVSGNYISRYNGTNLGPVTIDGRTLTTNYNVLDSYIRSHDNWLRGGFEWAISNNFTMKSQFYGYDRKSDWLNNEVIAFNAGNNLVDRERFYVGHNQHVIGNVTDLLWNNSIAGMENRTAVALGYNRTEFTRPGAANFPHDFVTLVDPIPGTYGLLTLSRQTANVNDGYVSVEDRLKVTRTFALVGGLRGEAIVLDRTSLDVNGITRAGFPYSKDWTPLTGRAGYTWEAIPGMTFYSQYATAADVPASNLFLISPTQPLNLTTARTYETGVKDLLWDGRAEWSFSAFDIERRNVYAAQAGQTLNIAGRVESRGVEFAAAVRPTPESKVWGNVAYVHARYVDYQFISGGVPGSFSGNTPPNVPAIVINGGASYRIATAWWPVEVGMSVTHVGDRYDSDLNSVKMLAYTTADAFMFVDIEKPSWFPRVDKTRLTFRVRNLTDEKYAVWGAPEYPNQILLGAPRSFEGAASFKF
jgi:iron complex outermembrane recepter protein